ncbi:GNAT family N-acetyltransferase [Kaistia algarum]|uniref:GNAT family N-acetyltransferase n=1 Tax=Kaistia algarum TaxID=2083279 RepID=UPI000CE7E26D|nr:GNAT family N-acetyltransferase [Kaistia algarum]MCX5513198.1 GNAT family N-acetyltransferase [Kaistia algarum]PPE81337.1 GNAT family N-acetyltransferase [Kaistia algarum]
MMDLVLRPITEADLPALLALYAQPSFNKGHVISLDAAKAIFARFAAYPDYAIYFAEADGEVLGTFALMIIDNIAHWGTPTAMIENVVVREDRQGGGIGRAMMNAACALAQTKGAYKVALSSNLANERGHAFYEGLGFEKHGFSFRLELAPSSFSLCREAGEGRTAVPFVEESAS